MESDHLEGWNPMEQDFRNTRFNSYRSELGQDFQNRDVGDVAREKGGGYKPVVLYVSNMPLDMDERALQNLFEQQGKVVKVHIPVQTEEKKAQYKSQIGFVTMDNARGGQAAIENLDGFLIKGKNLSVKVKLSKEEMLRKKVQRQFEEELFESSRTPQSSGVKENSVGNSSNVPGPRGDAGILTERNRKQVYAGDAYQRESGGRVTGLPAPQSMGRGQQVMTSLSRNPGHPRPAPSIAGTDIGSDLCASCHRVAKLRCTACKTVYYCNAQCQSNHWSLHRQTCEYESKRHNTSVPNPDFENMDADVSEAFMLNNKEYLQEWLKVNQAYSDSSSSSGQQLPGQPKFTSPGSQKGRRKERQRSDEEMSQGSFQRNGQGPKEPRKTQPRDSELGQQRQTRQYGGAGNANNRQNHQTQNGQLGWHQQGHELISHGGGPDAGRNDHSSQGKSDPQQDRGVGRFGQKSGLLQTPRGPGQPAPGDRPGKFQAGRDSHGPLQNRGPPQFMQGDRPDQFQSCWNGPQQNIGGPGQFGPRDKADWQNTGGPGQFRPKEKTDQQNIRGPSQNSQRGNFDQRNIRGPGQFGQREKPDQQNVSGPGQFGPKDKVDQQSVSGPGQCGMRDRPDQQNASGPGQFGPRDKGQFGPRDKVNQNSRGPGQFGQKDKSNQQNSGSPGQFERREKADQQNVRGPGHFRQTGRADGLQTDRDGPRFSVSQGGPTSSGQKPDQSPSNQNGLAGSQRAPGAYPFHEQPQKQGDGGPNQRQSQNRPGQNNNQRGSNRNGSRNRETGFQQQGKGNNKQRNNAGGPRSDTRPGASGEGDSDKWEGRSPKSSPLPGPSGGLMSLLGPVPGSTVGETPQFVVPVSSLPDQGDALELNQPVKVIVSHMDSPQSFWVQALDQMHSYAPLISQAITSYTGKGSPNTMARVGDIFLCEFMGELARARVVSVSGEKARIFYVDYGNSEDTFMSQLLPLPSEMASIPVLGFQCTLAVREASGKAWPDEVTARLREVFSENELCTATALRKIPPAAEVVLVRDSDGLDAASFLLENGFATALSSASAPASVSGVAAALPGASARVPSAAKRVLVSDLHTTLEQLSVGERVEVLLLDTLGPMDIFVRLCKLEKAFTDFSTKMVAHYTAAPETPYIPVVGELVVGRFSQDKSWYRAEVLEVDLDSGLASLFYVDFGNREQLPFQELRSVKKEYASVPVHGIRCALGGFSAPVGEQWSEEHTATYISCLKKYTEVEADLPKVTIILESVRDDQAWVDIVSEQLQQSLSEDLSQQLEGARLPQPIQPQVLPTSPTIVQSPPSPAMPALVQVTPPKAQPVDPQQKQSVKLEAAALPLDVKVICGIQDIESCERFYVTLREEEDALNALREKLNTFCLGLSGGAAQQCRSVTKGDLVLVQFSADNEWYRGRVEQVSDDGTNCSIFFVDYGNKEDKLVSSLKVLPPEFTAMAAQAIPCTLAGIPSTVPEEIETGFKSMCLQTEAVVRAVSKEQGVYSVEITSADDVSIAVLLGVQARPVSAQGKVTSGLESLQAAEVPEATADSTQPASPGLMESRELHVKLDSLPVAMVETEVMENMVVTHAVNPGHFYAVSMEHYTAQHQDGGLVPQLQGLSSSAPPLVSMPAVGDLLSGLFSGEWFRCEVVEILSSQIRVNFFDYGNEGVVSLSELRPLPIELCRQYPLATIKCSMDGLHPATGDSWDNEVSELTKTLLENQAVRLCVKAVQDGVHQVTITSTSGEDVGQALVDGGKAVCQSGAKDAEKEELLRQMAELQAKLAAMEAAKK